MPHLVQTVLGRKWLGLLPPAGAVLGAALAYATPGEYRAVSTVLATNVGAAVSANDLRFVIPTVVERIRSTTIVREALAELDLQEERFASEPAAFLQRHLAVAQRADSALVAIRVTLRDPEIAARVANRVADRVVARYRDDDDQRLRSASAPLAAQVASAREELVRADEELSTFLRGTAIEALRRQATRILDVQSDLERLQFETAAARRRHDSLVATLIDREPRRELRSEVLPRDEAAGSSFIGRGLLVNQESVDETFATIEVQAAVSEAAVAQLDAHRDALHDYLDAQPELDAVVSAPALADAEQQRLVFEVELRRSRVTELQGMLDRALFEARRHEILLQVADRAAVPQQSISLPPLRAAVLGGVGGVAMAICALLLIVARDSGERTIRP